MVQEKKHTNTHTRLVFAVKKHVHSLHLSDVASKKKSGWQHVNADASERFRPLYLYVTGLYLWNCHGRLRKSHKGVINSSLLLFFVELLNTDSRVYILPVSQEYVLFKSLLDMFAASLKNQTQVDLERSADSGLTICFCIFLVI